MAVGKDTSHRARFRKHERLQKRHHSPQRQGLSRRRPIARARAVRKKAPVPQLSGEALADHLRGLEVAMSAVIVSVSALRRQNCEIDEDIARVLERSAADRLDVEIEKLQSLINQEGRHEEA
jgi:hypothetical protein